MSSNIRFHHSSIYLIYILVMGGKIYTSIHCTTHSEYIEMKAVPSNATELLRKISALGRSCLRPGLRIGIRHSSLPFRDRILLEKLRIVLKLLFDLRQS